MSCEYCKHECIAYKHHKDDEGHDVYVKMAKDMPYDDCCFPGVEPTLTWPDPNFIDWADHKPRLCMTAFDQDGEEIEISIPVNFCPMCGRDLREVLRDE